MVRKIVLSIFAVLATAAMVVAQNRQVSGTVKDSAGQPIIGATVVVERVIRPIYNFKASEKQARKNKK